MFIARQPILNRALGTYGYELLYRGNSTNDSFAHRIPEKATVEVIGDLFESGIDKITSSLPAFVNFDYQTILSDVVELIDPQHLVIEILENTKVDHQLLTRIQELKRKGYKIALDDFEEDYHTYPLIPLADIIKYDIINTPLPTIRLAVKQGLQDHKILLAEKVETEEEYKQAKKMGFHLFQGYFFHKPSIISQGVDKKSTKLQYIRLIKALKEPEPSYEYIAEIIESDVNLSYRLMKIIKHRSQEDTIRSIKRALVYMGFDEIERWINILMLQDLATNKPKELTKLSLIRSKFGELIAIHSDFKDKRFEVSMMCLFSTLDAILDLPMEQTLAGIALSQDIQEALIHKKGSLRIVLDLILAYEKAQWQEVTVYAGELDINEDTLHKSYLSAIETSQNILSLM